MPRFLRRFTSKASKRGEVQLNEKIAAAPNRASKPATNGITKPIVNENAETVEDLISRIKTLAAKSDAVECTKIQDRLREAQYSLETPYETLLRLSAGVSDPCSSSLIRYLGEAANMGTRLLAS